MGARQKQCTVLMWQVGGDAIEANPIAHAADVASLAFFRSVIASRQCDHQGRR